MSSLATFEYCGTQWVAEQVIGESSRHNQIAAGAHRQRTPYCRRHLLGPNRGSGDSLPSELRDVLSPKFDLISNELDLVAVQYDKALDPLEALSQLQSIGRELLLVEGIAVPDSAYLENVSSMRGSRIYYDNYFTRPFNSNLTRSEVDDLRIATIAFTGMLLAAHND